MLISVESLFRVKRVEGRRFLVQAGAKREFCVKAKKKARAENRPALVSATTRAEYKML